MNILLKRWLLGVATATVAVVFLAPVPQRKALADAKSDDGWLVPRLPITTTDSQSVVSSLVQSKLWGSSAETPPAVDDKASRWRIAGITGRPAERYAIIQFGDDRVLLPTPGRRIHRQRFTEQHQANGPIQIRRHHFLQKEQPRRAPMPSAGCTCTLAPPPGYGPGLTHETIWPTHFEFCYRPLGKSQLICHGEMR